MIFVCLLLFIIFVLSPSNAFAWGAGVHLQIGLQLLDNLAMLPATIQTLLQAYPHDFLYGCISADITVGKKFTHYLNHCHAWRMGKKILDAAETDSQKSCAYGYLAHLATDTVAHAYFVPFKMVRTFNTVLLKHTYWELRLESYVDPKTWKLAQKIASENFRQNDEMLQNVLSNTIFSFKTNKKIFNSILLLSRLRRWQKMLRTMSGASKWVLDQEAKDEYFELATKASISVLCEMENSPYWHADPTGKNAIDVAKKIRKIMMMRWFDGTMTDEESNKIIAGLKPMFLSHITMPNKVKNLLPEVAGK